MTKQVRIENADTNNSVKVVVIVEDQINGEWKEVDRRELAHPTALSDGLYLTSSRRLLVVEEPQNQS